MKRILRKSAFMTACLFCIGSIYAQKVDLFTMPDSLAGTKNIPVVNTFYSTRLVNAQTVEITGKGSMDLRINHRFAPLNLGFYDMFGLDFASMRLGFDFGVDKNIMVGIGRTTTNKEFDGFVKYRLLHQTNETGGKPLSLAVLASMMYRNLKMDPTLKVSTSDRMYYTAQVLIARKFNDNTSLQLSPSWTHYNRVINFTGGSNNLFALGILARQKISRKVSVNAEYFLQSNAFNGTHNPLTIGVDIQTGGHVFQLHFSNSTGMNEHAFIHETFGSWGKGDIRWGFNISRIFFIGRKLR